MNERSWIHTLFSTGVILAVFLICCPTAYGAEADDPFYAKQSYLQQIHMNEAWDVAQVNTNITIAIVDTGVDLNHPDLKPNLVPGINLIHPELPPADDNGHGTNVAGVIAAMGNNDRGVAGILWRARIMPIKALEADGSGGEQRLGEGIRYAVDHGAKIVVLSLGLNKYSAYMSDIVKYAEERDVLLVAATGNEGNRVKYPAAYPTVLAVGGLTADGTADSRSNTGPEVDLLAPWDVFTTGLDGNYESKDGTSMAAPQAAAVAALAWTRNPGMKAYEIRQFLRQTAQDLGGKGWDETTGYGMLRADRMMTEMYLADMYEPNNRKDQAKSISVSKKISASFAGGSDIDWYYVDAPYDGTINLSLDMNSAMSASVQHTNATGVLTSKTVQGGQVIPLKVSKGRSYFQLQLTERGQTMNVPYQLETSFDIYRDPYEDNDKQFMSYVLPSRSLSIKGTFHQYNDTDWFEFPVEQSGSLRIRLSTDTARMDPVLLVQKQGEKSVILDKGDDGVTETMFIPEVFPGSYYIRVTNVKDYANPVVGEYTLSFEYDAKLIDPNEPNNRSYQATTVSLNTPYNGLLDKLDDVDWYQFTVDEESLVQVRLTDIPSPATMYMNLYDGALKPIASSMNTPPNDSQQLSGRFQPGTYYVKLNTNRTFDHHMYQLLVSAQPLTGGYTDIRGHWAQDAILSLSSKQVINGYDDYTFQPDRPITRAEATAVLSRAFNWSKQRAVSYTDLNESHWAYGYIAHAAQAGVIDGYPDRTFAPDQPVSRMEMTAMLARSMNMTGKRRGNVPFTDVDENYWGIGLLKQMKAEGWISGYADGSFHPDQQATRGEFVTLLSHLLR
ncbi:S8 family serine peptidase [Paenibacillus cremeus]|uniref:S8 family serine peptidase n=1 Tax=Paenibacillus cremeus TaxID=2163881 RepID=A0A559KAZ7_9BACL|nr:S8 family serine peptidase [Paenibacillus cremeus]TVY09306.1 S8 family serine peptidase [Paenibacillus cremeus]